MDARELRFTPENLNNVTGLVGWSHVYMEDDPSDPLFGHRRPRSSTYAHHVYNLHRYGATAYHVIIRLESPDVARTWWSNNKDEFSERNQIIPSASPDVPYLLEVRGVPWVETMRAQLDDIDMYEGPTNEWCSQPGLDLLISMSGRIMKIVNIIVLRGNEVHKVFIAKNNPNLAWNPRDIAIILMRDYVLTQQ